MHYLVKAVHNDGSVLALSIDAASESEAGAFALRQGHAVISVSAGGLQWRGAGGRQAFSILLFSQDLLALLTAGLSLIEALQALKEREIKYRGGGVVGSVVKSLSEGLSFSAAISHYPRVFPQLYVASIQASERTGDLSEALRRFITYQEQMERVRKVLISAATYPALVLSAGVLVIGFLMLYVVPRFSTVYESYSGDMGFFTGMLISAGKAVSNHGMLVSAFTTVVLLGLGAAAASARVRAKVAATIRLIPFVADKARLYELSRLYRTLGMLLRGGLPILRAAGMVAPLMSEESRTRVSRAAVLISEGRTMSSAFEEVGLTTAVAAHMLVVGERTGEMGPMMERIAVFHEDDLSRWLEHFTKLFEPILMLAIGLVVGFIVVLMYMPIFELATAIQ
jgi:general secretion pathway protein F